MSWLVIDRSGDVYSTWARDCAPSPDEEAGMLSWFDYLESALDAPAIDGRSPSGLSLTTGPNGEEVEFALVVNPRPGDGVKGAIVLRRIGCSQAP